MGTERNLTSYIRNDEGDKHIVYDRDGNQIGSWIENGDGEEYKGTPTCALLPGKSENDITGGAAILTTSYKVGLAARQAGAAAVYILSGGTDAALKSDYRALGKNHKEFVILDVPEADGTIASERPIVRRLGLACTVKVPGRAYRKSAAGGVTAEVVRMGIATAESALSPQIESFSGVKESSTYDIEKIKTPWPGLNHKLYGGLPRGQVTLFCGKSSQGKSTMALQMLGCALEQGHRVGIYSGEGSKEDITDTLTRQIAGREHLETFERGGRDCYKVESKAREDILDDLIVYNMVFVKPDRRARKQWTGLCDNIIDLIENVGVDTIMIDNIMTAARLYQAEFGASELEAQGCISDWMEYISVQYHVWVIGVAHLRKFRSSGSDTNDNVSGASAIVNSAGVVLHYEPISDKPDSTERILRLTKNRLYGELCYDGIKMDFDRPTKRAYEAGSPRTFRYVSAWARKYDEGVWEIELPDEMTFEECEKEEKEILAQILPGVDVKIRFVYPSGYRTITPKTYSLMSAVEITRDRKYEGRRIFFREER